MSYTKGEWTVNQDNVVCEDDDNINVSICFMDKCRPKEWKANAQLISASPSLLLAVKCFLDPNVPEWEKKIQGREAIAKAERE